MHPARRVFRNLYLPLFTHKNIFKTYVDVSCSILLSYNANRNLCLSGEFQKQISRIIVSRALNVYPSASKASREVAN